MPTVPASAVRSIDAPGAAPPPPSFLSQVGASFRTSIDTQTLPQVDRLGSAYKSLEDSLVDAGIDRSSLYTTSATPDAIAAAGQGFAPATVTTLDPDKVWRAIDLVRQRNPKAFASLPATREQFDQETLRRNGGRDADQALLARGHGPSGLAANLIGGAGASFADPLNDSALFVGGGAETIAKAVLWDGLTNAGLQALQTPETIAAREKLGETTTPGEVASDIVSAGVFGGLVGGTGKAFGHYVLPPAREAVLGALYPHLPQGLRDRMTSGMTAPDDALPDIAESVIGAGNMSPDEIAASNVIGRESAIKASNPFVPDGAGIAAHRGALADAMRQILDDVPAPSGPRDPRARLAGSTALSSGTVASEGATILKQRIHGAEAPSDTATNPRSSALGPYQFLRSTWLTLYKRRFGSGGLSDDAIAAKRTDPKINDVLVDDLIGINARALQRAGHAPDAGNLYLAHFAGADGADRLLDADPNTPAASILGDKVVAANPFLKDWTAGQVVDWAHRKMGADGAPASFVGDADPEATTRQQLNDAWQQLEAERTALDQGQPPAPNASDVVAASLEENAVPADDVDAAVAAAPSVAPGNDAGSTPVDALVLVPKVRAIVANRSRSLADIDGIAAELDAPPDAVRGALDHLAGTGALRRNRKTGSFMRPPREGPLDVLKFLARHGGLHESGMRGGGPEGFYGHGLGAARIVGTRRVGGRDLQTFVPGAGPLLRESGMGADEAGELLWESGYFGPHSNVDRPTEDQVLSMLENAVHRGDKFYPHGDTPEAAEPVHEASGAGPAWQPGEFEHFADGLAATAKERFDLDLTDAEIEAAARTRRRLTTARDYEVVDPDEAVAAYVNEEIDAARWDALEEDGNAVYEQLYDDHARDFGGQDQGGGDGGGGHAADAGDARAQPTGSGAGSGDAAGLATERLKSFDEPDGAGPTAQLDSLDHDVRAALDHGEAADPNIADKQRQQAQLKADSPLQATTDQDSTIGAPLFDAADQFGFRLGEEGDTINAADLIKRIDDENSAIEAVKKCL